MASLPPSLTITITDASEPKDGLDNMVSTLGSTTTGTGPDWLGLTRAIAGGYDFISRLIQLLIVICQILEKDAEVSISFLDDQLVQQGVFSSNANDSANHLTNRKSRHATVFICIGWITNLYHPAAAPRLFNSDGSFIIDTEQATCFDGPIVNPELISRPLPEMLHNLGDLLPPISRRVREDGAAQGFADTAVSAKLHVASLNISTLCRLASAIITRRSHRFYTNFSSGGTTNKPPCDGSMSRL
ncbi:hypothetical protein VTJ04DRAFT_4223 [Mycothermus thermophilus]|uniref:uncharacterized protein n=1 Tax=Humicola insolens TaxID=85995 RepID=UPI003743AF36